MVNIGGSKPVFSGKNIIITYYLRKKGSEWGLQVKEFYSIFITAML